MDPRRHCRWQQNIADEWNAVYLDLGNLQKRGARSWLNILKPRGREVDDIKYSLMTQVVYRPTQALLEAHSP